MLPKKLEATKFKQDEFIKQIILYNSITGDELGELLFNITDSIEKLFRLIIKNVNVFNIDGIIIYDELWKPTIQSYDKEYNRIIQRFNQSKIINNYFKLDESNNIRIGIIYGSYKNYIKSIIIKFEKNIHCIGYVYDKDQYKDKKENYKNIFINDINKIPEKYFSLNLDEYDEIIFMINNRFNIDVIINRNFIIDELNKFI